MVITELKLIIKLNYKLLIVICELTELKIVN